jgi:CelD/BcsL family acetyltransferase involved in cellulose biosynthesis
MTATAILPGSRTRATTTIIDPTKDEEWSRFIGRNKDAGIFHTAAWARVIEESYHYVPRYYALLDGSRAIRAALPLWHVKSRLTGNRLVCLPFSDTCYPLGDEADIVTLLDAVKADIAGGQASHLEIRGLPSGVAPSRTGLVGRPYYALYVVNLKRGPKQLMRDFHNNVRRSIRQAEGRDVTVRLSREKADLDAYYTLHVQTRKKLGVLPQPRSFFNSLYNNVIEPGLGYTGLAESDGKCIAGVVFLRHGTTLYYKFNASDEAYLRKRPNHLITWLAIEEACAEGFQYLDLGRCAPEEESLRIYKTRWGADEIDLPYYYFPTVQGISSQSETSGKYKAMQLFSRLAPMFAFKAAGSLLYRHLA